MTLLAFIPTLTVIDVVVVTKRPFQLSASLLQSRVT
jgi:hypothetical protein